LYADGTLAEGAIWRQESIVGSVFEAWAVKAEGGIRPQIRGSAYVNAESTLVIDPDDPFALGIRS
jgi:4-hydroxyproline epimerase